MKGAFELFKAISCRWGSGNSVLVTPSHMAWCDKRRRHAKDLSRESKTTNTFLHRCMKNQEVTYNTTTEIAFLSGHRFLPLQQLTVFLGQCSSIFLVFINQLERTLDCFASPWNSAKLHHVTLKNAGFGCFSPRHVSFHYGSYMRSISNPTWHKPSQTPTLANSMAYSFGGSI